MKRSLVLSMILALGVVVIVSGCRKEKITAGERAKLVATVDQWKLTHDELRSILDRMPSDQKAKYETPTGKVDLVDAIIQDELYYEEGKKLGIDNEEEVKKQIEQAIRNIIITAYFNRFVKERARPTEEEMHDYYEENQDKFKTQAVIRAQHIFSKDREKLVEIKKRIENGEAMTTLAHKLSEDPLSRPDGGDLGYFNPGGYIRFVGYSKKFSDAVFALEPGVVSDPIKFEKGYSIVRVNSKKPARLKTFEEVKGEIERWFINRRLEETKKQVFEELKKKHDVHNYLQEELDKMRRSPEELWNLAQTSTDSYQRLSAYKEICDKYPDSKYAPQALFMQGFVYAEELKDQFMAEKTFEQVVLKYPGTDVARSAKWMKDNLGKPMPSFEDLDDLNQQIKEKESKKQGRKK